MSFKAVDTDSTSRFYTRHNQYHIHTPFCSRRVRGFACLFATFLICNAFQWIGNVNRGSTLLVTAIPIPSSLGVFGCQGVYPRRWVPRRQPLAPVMRDRGRYLRSSWELTGRYLSACPRCLSTVILSDKCVLRLASFEAAPFQPSGWPQDGSCLIIEV
jgi:hypothetical protein